MDGQLTRRQWMTHFSGAIIAAQWLPSLLKADESKASITATASYVLDLQTEGKLSLGNEDKKHEIPFSVSCQQDFHERLIIREDIRLATREYTHASLEKRFGNQTPEQIQLKHSKILAFAQSPDSGRMEFRTPDQKLTEEQWNLLETPFSPIWLNELAREILGSQNRLTVGQKIKVSDILVARLFTIETLTSSTIECEVEKANSSQAVLKLTGEAKGQILDAETSFKVNASLRCIFQDATITQLRASFVETREEGGVHPQFTASTKMKLDVSEPKNEISNPTVRQLLSLSEEAAILTYVSDKNPVQLDHSNQWHLVMDQRGEVTWRMIASGEALTQCKLLLLATKTESDISLKDWVEVVESAHPESETTIASTETIQGQAGTKIYRVQVHGKEAGVDLAWIHYYVSFPDGTRGELAFTTEQSFVPTLGETDRLMAQSLTQIQTRVAAEASPDTK